MKVWVNKTFFLLMGVKKVICNIWSQALEFGWVRPPLLMGKRKLLPSFRVMY